jgi:hypothetical protein
MKFNWTWLLVAALLVFAYMAGQQQHDGFAPRYSDPPAATPIIIVIVVLSVVVSMGIALYFKS